MGSCRTEREGGCREHLFTAVCTAPSTRLGQSFSVGLCSTEHEGLPLAGRSWAAGRHRSTLRCNDL